MRVSSTPTGISLRRIREAATSPSPFVCRLNTGFCRGKLTDSMTPPEKEVPTLLIVVEVVALIAFIVVVVKTLVAD